MSAGSSAWAQPAAAAPPVASAPARYALDPAHSFVHFEVLHFGTSTLRGRFGPIEGDVVLDPAAGRGEVGLRIATAGVSTGLAVLDARLRRPDLLASEAYPEAYFVASNFRFDAAGRPVELRGELTLRDVSRPLVLRALRFACAERPALQREVCGGDFEAELLRSDFGASLGLPLVADRVRLQVQVEGIRR